MIAFPRSRRRSSEGTSTDEDMEERNEAMRSVSQEQVNKSLAEVMHPEIDSSLVDLGMIEDVLVDGNKVRLALVLPFAEVPIKGHLMNGVKKALADVDQAIEVEIDVRQMNPQERDQFMKRAKEGWKL